MSAERGALSDADRRQSHVRVPFVIGQVLVFAGLLVAGLGPFLWLLKAAISPTQDSIRQPLALFPSGKIQWQNLATAWLALYIGQIGVPKLDRGTLQVPVATTKAPPAPKTTRLAP